MSSTGTHAAAWQLPQISGPVVGRSRRREDLDAIARDAFDQGFAEGRQAGIAAAQQEQQAAEAEITARVQQLDKVLQFMARPIEQLDSEVQLQLAALAGAIARQVIRREIKTARPSRCCRSARARYACTCIPKTHVWCEIGWSKLPLIAPGASPRIRSWRAAAVA
jgi:hypothetical protein